MQDAHTREIDKILAEQSAALLEAVKRQEPGSNERLVEWLSESRRHVQHYLMMVALDRELESIDAERNWNLNVAAATSTQNVIPLTSSPAPALRQTHRHRRLWTYAAALVASLLLLVGFYALMSRERQFATAVGEQRAIELEDGSVVHLNTQSRVEVQFSKQGRNVHLLAGEALFKVHHDSARPFRVYTSDAVIQAIGTEFNVYRRPEGTIVSVLEGSVQVSQPAANASHSTNLGAGQQARVDHAGQIAAAPSREPAALASWRQRRLIFKSTPLLEMVTEFNRYNRAPHFELRGPAAPERTFSGIFDADDPESLIELLKKEPGLSLERHGDEVSISAARR
jgi:transmembrane sensor